MTLPPKLAEARAQMEAAQPAIDTSSNILDEILLERIRQWKDKEWSYAHDDQHGNGELGRAAAYYAACNAPSTYVVQSYSLALHLEAVWPWDVKYRRPRPARENLIRAGALIVAEIERLDRAEGPASPGEAAD